MDFEKLLVARKEAAFVFCLGVVVGVAILSFLPLLQSDKPATKEQITEAIQSSPCVQEELNHWVYSRNILRESAVKATVERCAVITAQRDAFKTE